MVDDVKNKPEATGTDAASAMVDLAFQSPIPRMYFNGFAVAYGPSDTTLVLQLNGTPIALLHTSYPIAKTLAEKLTLGIREVEKAVSVTFPSNEEMLQRMEQGPKK